MPRRRQRNRYVEIYDQELSGRPLLYEGIPCSLCGLPLLGEHSYDMKGRWVHLDCDEPPERSDVASHLLLHEMWDTGLDPETLGDSITDEALDEAIDRYLANWRLARAASDKSGRRAGADFNSASPANLRATHAGTTSHRAQFDPTASSAVATRSAILRLKQRIESAPHGRARVAVRVPRQMAVLLARELSDLTTIGSMPDFETGTLTLGIPAENRPAVVDRLQRMHDRLPMSR